MEEKVYAEHPFKRGSMKFDDFNYQVYNPYILIEDLTASLNPDEKERSHKKRQQSINKKTESEELSYAAMEKVEVPDYNFDPLVIKTETEL